MLPAFGSTYARESAFDDDVWRQRILNPKATTFVATQGSDYGKRLVSSLTLWASDDNDRLDSYLPMSWHVSGVYTLADARRKGVASAVMDAARKFALEQAGFHGRDCVLAVKVFSGNLAARQLYEKTGFTVKKQTEDGILEMEAALPQSR